MTSKQPPKTHNNTPSHHHPPPSLEQNDIQCNICTSILYKPCINQCGHAFCFWCTHRSMDGMSVHSRCPLCRTRFRFFPAVCIPLHRYLAFHFEDEMKRREEEVRVEERDDFNAESPQVELFGEGKKKKKKKKSVVMKMMKKSKKKNEKEQEEDDDDEVWDVEKEFQCAGCGSVACPPTVLSCGHIICHFTKEDDKQKITKSRCPVEGCVGTVSSGSDEEQQEAAVCMLIDQILRNELAEERYNQLVALSKTKQCALLTTTNNDSGNADAQTEETTFRTGESVVLHNLTFVLNGRRGRIISYSSSDARYIVQLYNPLHQTDDHEDDDNDNNSLSSRQLSIHTSNLQPDTISPSEYIHYGVGCDGCGQFPIVGSRFKCMDCHEDVGFDLCGSCHHDDGGTKMNKMRILKGRFNQKHKRNHVMKEMEQDMSILHRLQTQNPEVPLRRLVDMLMEQQQMVSSSDDDSEGSDDDSNE